MTNTQGTSEVLKIDTVGRVRTPREKQEEILAAYSGSGMTGQQFAGFCGVKYSTLMSWVGKARRANKPGGELSKAAAMSWVEALAMLTDGIDLRGAKMRPWYERQ